MQKATVLIIDDNLRQQASLEHILEPMHYDVLRTDTTEKALDILRYTEVAVILLDFSLKGLDLHAFMNELRRHYYSENTFVILVMDKEHRKKDVQDLYNSGAVDYIEKPFNPGTVRSMIKVFIRLFQKTKRVRELLLNILPREIAEELEEKGKIQPKRYGVATVMFTDFVSFSVRTREMTPLELVNQLDWYFAHFDKIISKYYLEKIKTIGDAYMLVSGVPDKRKENPVLAAMAALEIANFMEKVRSMKMRSGRAWWELRIGLHSGPLVAGVIGKSKFAYDIWGNTVNTASRICTACEPGKVNVSSTTWEKIKPYFEGIYRGEIETKNIGHIGMYFVTGIKPEYSIGGNKIKANKELKQIAGLIFVQWERLKNHILNRLDEELPANLYYHGSHHTKEVLDCVMRIGKEEELDEEEQLLLNTAALLHDCGYLYTYYHNEELAVKMCKKILPDFGYTPSQIKVISGIIRATKIKSFPRTHYSVS
jgi:adenylate cyclase